MPIRPPALDDRGFADLVADMLRRVPAHTPEWTDLRDGDPGRTLIDLFAWMGDTILYRANLIPERQRLAFLRLLGKPLRAASPAHGMVQVSIDDPAATAPVVLPLRHVIAKPMQFEFDSELAVLPIEGRAYLKRRPTATELSGMSALIRDLKELYSISGSAAAYVTTPVFVGGMAEASGRDVVAESIDLCLWFALLAPTPEPAIVAAVRDTLGGGATIAGSRCRSGSRRRLPPRAHSKPSRRARRSRMSGRLRRRAMGPAICRSNCSVTARQD